MNELEQQLSKILEQAIKVAEKTGEFAIEQAPLLLQEFYRWHLTKNVFFILIGIFLFLLLNTFRNMFGLKENPEPDYDTYRMHDNRYFDRYGATEIGRYIFKCASLIIPSLIIVTAIYNIIFLIVAPKLYLIEYFVK